MADIIRNAWPNSSESAVGEPVLLGRWPAGVPVEAVTDSVVSRYADFNHDRPARCSALPLHAILECLRDRHEHDMHRVQILSHLSTTRRLAAFLLSLKNRLGGISRLEMPMRRIDVADYLFATPETISRSFKRLVDMDLITTGRRSVLIRDEAGLRELAE